MGCLARLIRFLNAFKDIIARVLFSTHALICIAYVTLVTGNEFYWLLSLGLCLLVFEAILSVCLPRHHSDVEWFCPAVFLYLVSSVPSLWILELYLLAERHRTRSTATRSAASGRVDAFGDGFKIPGIDLNFNVSIKQTDWVRILEQVLMLLLILGRWLLPKRGITRDQLSQLLLVYIGIAADILELFEAFKEPTVMYETVLVIVVMTLFSVALMQFTFTMTATKARRTRFAQIRRDRDEEATRARSDGADEQEEVEEGQEEEKRNCCTGCCETEVWAIMMTVFLQDGPFLALRLTLIIHFGVVSYSNIFFTTKNALVIALQVYRLIVLHAERGSDEEDPPNGKAKAGPASKPKNNSVGAVVDVSDIEES